MKIGIISDTHDQVERAEQAAEIFSKEAVDKIYHLGDWSSPFMLGIFKNLSCQILSIFGNNDADIFKLVKNKPDNLEFKDRFFVETISDKKICLFHGDPQELVNAIFDSKRYDVVLRGHNHEAEIKRNGKTTLINPGSLIGPTNANPQWTPASIAIYNLANEDVKQIEIQ